MELHCRSNLDLQSEKWPTNSSQLGRVPVIDDYIQSQTIRNPKRSPLELIVVRVTFEWKENWMVDYNPIHKLYVAYVELHLPPYRFEGITKFEEWYRKIGTT